MFSVWKLLRSMWTILFRTRDGKFLKMLTNPPLIRDNNWIRNKLDTPNWAKCHWLLIVISVSTAFLYKSCMWIGLKLCLTVNSQKETEPLSFLLLVATVIRVVPGDLLFCPLGQQVESWRLKVFIQTLKYCNGEFWITLTSIWVEKIL